MIKALLTLTVTTLVLSSTAFASDCSWEKAEALTKKSIQGAPGEVSNVLIGSNESSPSPYRETAESDSIISVYFSYIWQPGVPGAGDLDMVGHASYRASDCKRVDYGGSGVAPVDL